jgi:hypothetical protein
MQHDDDPLFSLRQAAVPQECSVDQRHGVLQPVHVRSSKSDRRRNGHDNEDWRGSRERGPEGVCPKGSTMTLQDILKAENEILDALEKARERGKLAYVDYLVGIDATEARIAALSWVIAAREQGLDHEE